MPEGSAHSRALPALLAVCLTGAGWVNARAVPSATPSQSPAPASLPASEVLQKYCVTCHNGRLKTAGLQIDSLDVRSRGRRRAAVGKDRHEAAHRRDAAAGAAAAGCRRPIARSRRRSNASSMRRRPRRRIPGRVPVHRLNRSEYTNAIRDLLGPRDRWTRPAVVGRGRPGRLRQRGERAVGVAGAARELPVGRANDQPARGRRSGAAIRSSTPSRSPRRWCRTNVSATTCRSARRAAR